MIEALLARRNELMYDSMKKMDIIHPNAFYIETKSNTAVGTKLWTGWWGLINATEVIIDGEPYTGSMSNILTQDGNNLKWNRAGKHSYYFKMGSSVTYNYLYFWNNNAFSLLRLARSFNHKLQGTPDGNIIALTKNVDITASNLNPGTKIFYIPQGSLSTYSGKRYSKLVEVKYNIIED